jgi:hypothetical protein
MERRAQRTLMSEHQRQEVNERLVNAAELGRATREAAQVQRSIIDLNSSIESVKRQRATEAAPPLDLEQRQQRARENWLALRERQQAVASVTPREIIVSPNREQGREREPDQSRDHGLEP